jgi:aryl-alcohol dehydrogenase-like predicted oxidoreductase
LKAEGVRIGLTTSGPSQADVLRRALEIERDGTPLFQSVQATWNLLEPSAAPALAEARAAGLGVVIKEGLGNGRLTERNREPDFQPKLAVLRREAERFGTAVDAVSLSACMAQPFADIVLSGAATSSQLRSNLRARDVRLDGQALARLAPLAESPREYWSKRRALGWN